MTNETGSVPEPKNQRRYIWPWFVLAAVLLAIALAVAWMSREIERTRRIRDLNAPAAPADREPSPSRSGREPETAIKLLARSNALRAEDGSRSAIVGRSYFWEAASRGARAGLIGQSADSVRAVRR